MTARESIEFHVGRDWVQRLGVGRESWITHLFHQPLLPNRILTNSNTLGQPLLPHQVDSRVKKWVIIPKSLRSHIRTSTVRRFRRSAIPPLPPRSVRPPQGESCPLPSHQLAALFETTAVRAQSSLLKSSNRATLHAACWHSASVRDGGFGEHARTCFPERVQDHPNRMS